MHMCVIIKNVNSFIILAPLTCDSTSLVNIFFKLGLLFKLLITVLDIVLKLECPDQDSLVTPESQSEEYCNAIMHQYSQQ